MSKDITAPGPSRRQIAKGAAWAVPAVTVAAAAPALAASPTVCPAGTLTVATLCPPLLSTTSLRFRITNPAGSGCTVPAGTPLTLNVSGLAGLDATLLNGINANAGVLFTTATDATLQQALAPGQSITLNVFPRRLLYAQVAGTASLSIEGSSASASYIIATVAGLSVAICA